MNRKQRRACRQPDKLSVGEVWALCPYRTLLGFGAGLDPDPKKLMKHIGCTIAVLGGVPEPLSERMLMDALAVLNAGRVVLLILNDACLRDFAKNEIMTMAGRVGGTA